MRWDGRGGGDVFRLEREDGFHPINGNQPKEESDQSQKNQTDGNGRAMPWGIAKQFFAVFAGRVFAVKAGEGHTMILLPIK